jgi:hypothetical protein
MQWTVLDPLPFNHRLAVSFNRRIEALITFRAAADVKAAPGNRFYRPGEAVDEALRRELLLRTQIQAFLLAHNFDGAAANAAAAAAVRAELTNRGAHRS